MKLPRFDSKNVRHNLIAELASKINNINNIRKADIKNLEKLIYELILK